MEADFLRDYGIRLVEQLDTMTWRYFLTLVNNLSPYGAAATRISEIREKPEPSDDPDEDRRAAEAFFASVVAV